MSDARDPMYEEQFAGAATDDGWPQSPEDPPTVGEVQEKGPDAEEETPNG